MNYANLVETIQREIARLDAEEEFQKLAKGWRDRARLRLNHELRYALKQRRLFDERRRREEAK